MVVDHYVALALLLINIIVTTIAIVSAVRKPLPRPRKTATYTPEEQPS